jgi:putative ABC transport system permease protein
MSDRVPRLLTRLARALPDAGFARVWEPSLEELRAERRSRAEFLWRAVVMLAECYWVALWAALTGPRRRRQMEPQAEAIGMMDTLTQDARYAGRMLLKNPGFTSVAVLALALSIGANAVIFSLIDNLFVRPLPYAHADSLIRLWGQSTDGRQQRLPASVPKFEYLRRSQESSVALAADSGLVVAMTRLGDQPQRVSASIVTDNYFDVLGVPPIAGRTFLQGEEDRAPVVVITRQFWVNRLLSDPNAVGRTLTLDSRPYTVVGIVDNLPASDVGPVEAFLPMPVSLSGLTPELRQRGIGYLRITGRLNPGVTIEQARAEAAILAERYRDENREKADSSLREIAIRIREDLTGNVRPAILTLLAAVALVLLIACSNVANLLTARFAGRRREIALRAALGAKRARIVRLFLFESLLLSALGAIAGLGVARLCLDILPALGATNLPLDGNVTITPAVLWATASVALATGVLMGIYPALQAARPSASDALKDGGRGVSGARTPRRVRSVLVACQVSLSLMLLVGAALLIASFANLRRQEPGFDPTRVLTADVSLPASRYPDASAQQQFRQRLLDALRVSPGIESAALGASVALTGIDWNAPFARGDGRVPPLHERLLGLTRSVSPGYFATMSIPVVGGRDFSEHDAADSPRVIVISQSTARKLFPDTDAIGKTIVTGSLGGGTRCEIVGIVGDVRSVNLAQPNDVEFYLPFTQRPLDFAQIVVRTAGNPLRMLNDVRAAVRAVDPELPLNQPRALVDVADASLGQRKLLMTLLGAFAGLALLLATVGIYSVVAYLVGQRRGEIGVRLALGASNADVLRLVTLDGLRPVTAGLAIGVVGVATLGRLLTTQLYGVSALDPTVLAAAVSTLGAVGLIACLVPARRATRIDPAIALRAD